MDQISVTQTNDRRILAFYASSSQVELTSRLFTVIQRNEMEYPVTVNFPTDESLPTYLRRKYYIPSSAESIAEYSSGNLVENMVASSPQKFIDKVREAFNSPAVKVRFSRCCHAPKRKRRRPRNSPKDRPANLLLTCSHARTIGKMLGLIVPLPCNSTDRHENRRTSRKVSRLLRIQRARPQAERRARAHAGIRRCCSRRPA